MWKTQFRDVLNKLRETKKFVRSLTRWKKYVCECLLECADFLFFICHVAYLLMVEKNIYLFGRTDGTLLHKNVARKNHSRYDVLLGNSCKLTLKKLRIFFTPYCSSCTWRPPSTESLPRWGGRTPRRDPEFRQCCQSCRSLSRSQCAWSGQGENKLFYVCEMCSEVIWVFFEKSEPSPKSSKRIKYVFPSLAQLHGSSAIFYFQCHNLLHLISI